MRNLPENMQKQAIKKHAIKIEKIDNVATVACNIMAGDEIKIDNSVIKALEDIPMGHKIAIIPIKKGDVVTKYGEPIGKATINIDKGQWVHVHNLIGLRGRNANA